MEFKTLRFELEGSVATITLERPNAYNALDLTMAQELREAVRRADMEQNVRALLLCGSGKAFCAGGDVASFRAALPAPQQLIKDIVLALHDAIAVLSHLNKPVIGAINGVAAGAGLGLALAPDIAIAARSARFTMAYTQIGASPDAGTTFYLPRLIGLRRALELTYDNRVLSADEALHWGLVNQVVDDAELADVAKARARALAEGPTRALGVARRLLHSSFDSSLESQLMNEGRGISGMSGTMDFAEGVSAFRDKRKPTFRGE